MCNVGSPPSHKSHCSYPRQLPIEYASRTTLMNAVQDSKQSIASACISREEFLTCHLPFRDAEREGGRVRTSSQSAVVTIQHLEMESVVKPNSDTRGQDHRNPESQELLDGIVAVHGAVGYRKLNPQCRNTQHEICVK